MKLPQLRKQRSVKKYHGHELIDDYAWVDQSNIVEVLKKPELLLPEVKEYIEKLIEINSKLWLIEDDIRDCEKKKQFDQKFIDLARAIYITNDRRSEIKLEINKKFGSKLVEVKSYEKY